jgi:excisionase family DNA binding protein
MRDQPDKMLTIDEVARYVKASKRMVYRLAASSQVPVFKLADPWRFRHGEFDQWIASRIGNAIDGDSGKGEQ